jgi:septin family protein
MKSSYELAMERLNQQGGPTKKISAAQKKKLADLDSRHAAKLAEREIALKGELATAAAKGDAEAYQQLEKQLVSERKSLLADLEEKKEKVRQQQR